VLGLLLVGSSVVPAVVAPAASAATAGQSFVFDQPGTSTFVVPAGVCSVTVRARGAAGGRGPSPESFFYRRFGQAGAAGRGGEVTATIAVAGGQHLEVNVGEQGQPNRGGFGGGGAGAGGGGGASDIRVGGGALTDRIVVAAGGGGASGGTGVPWLEYPGGGVAILTYTPLDGAGGGDAGAPGEAGRYGERGVSFGTVSVPSPLVKPNTGGAGATATAGGVGGTSEERPELAGASGRLGHGGDAARDPVYYWDPDRFTGGGGGGGYFGGGAGAPGGEASYYHVDDLTGAHYEAVRSHSGGGGGSNFAAASLVAVSMRTDVSTGHGSVQIDTNVSPEPCDLPGLATTTTTSTTLASTDPTTAAAAPAAQPATLGAAGARPADAVVAPGSFTG
jgi:hypothetical protein